MSVYDPATDSDRLILQAQLYEEADNIAISRVLNRPIPSPARVLDVGCANGHVTATRFGHRPHTQVLAIEPAALPAAEARARLVTYPHIAVEQLTYQELASPPESYDLVFCALVLHLLDDVTTALADLWSLVAPGGALIVRSGDDGMKAVWPTSPEHELIMATEYLPNMVPRRLGRRLHTEFARLLPTPEIRVDLITATITTETSPTTRAAYFDTMYPWRAQFTAALAATEPDPGPLTLQHQQLLAALATERQRFVSDSSVFACDVGMLATAFKEA